MYYPIAPFSSSLDRGVPFRNVGAPIEGSATNDHSPYISEAIPRTQIPAPNLNHHDIMVMNYEFTKKTEQTIATAIQLAKEYANAQGKDLSRNLGLFL